MTAERHKFVIKAPLGPFGASVELDGEPLTGVTRISFSLTGGQMTEVCLTVYGEVLVEGEFRPKEIAQIKRQELHPSNLRVRIRDTFRKIFSGIGEDYIEALTNNAMHDLDPENETIPRIPAAAHRSEA